VSTDFPGHPRDDLSGDVPGEHLGDFVASEPGLDALLGMLAADATPDELADEGAALAMFRANRQPFAAGQPEAWPPAADTRLLETPGTSGPHAGGRTMAARRGSGRPTRRAGLMAAAVTLAAAAGFAVAAYTAALPTPLQQAAYQMLRFAGVPAAHHSKPAATSSSPPGNTPGQGHPSSKPGPSASASPQPSSSAPVSLTGQASLSLSVTSGRIVAGTNDTFTGQLTDKSGGVAGASVNLLERGAGQRAWHRAGTSATGANGTAVITAPDLTVNAAFRLSGPDGTMSRPVLVIVVPPVSAEVSGSGRMASKITASSPLAAPGDTVVLQVLSGKHWMNLQLAKLNGARQAQFMVRSRLMQRRYRVVLMPTVSHGLSVSDAVTVPPR
jgi:hypothetical protein